MIEEELETSEAALAGVLRGLQKYCSEHPFASKARALYEKKLAVYLEKYG